MITPRFPLPVSSQDFLTEPIRVGSAVEVFLVTGADGDIEFSTEGPGDFFLIAAAGGDIEIAASGTQAARLMMSTVTGDVVIEGV